MWLIIAVLFVLLFVVDAKVKHPVAQPILFVILILWMAATFTYAPTWLEHLV